MGNAMDGKRKPLGPLDVRNLGPGLHNDADVKGLYLRVLPSGGRSFILRYQVDGRRRDMHLGSTREVTLAEARTAARGAWAQLRAGQDPIDARHRQRVVATRESALADWTFERAAREVHSTLLPGWRNPKHGDQWINTLATYAFPKIGTRPVGDIDVAAVLTVLKPIWTTKAETARRVRQRIDQVMRWAVAHDYAATNPVDAASTLLPKQRDQVEHHRAVAVAAAPAFWRDLSALDPNPARLALQWVMLTAARSGEVRGATWGEIDMKAKLWTVPPARMKAGRAHQVPLSAAAIAVLDEAAAQFGSEPEQLIFPSPTGRALSDNAFTALLDRMKVDATAHGMRSTFRDWCSENSVPREVAERALAHAVADSTEAAYNRTQLLEQRRPVMAKWAAFLGSTR
jgi:integrase